MKHCASYTCNVESYICYYNRVMIHLTICIIMALVCGGVDPDAKLVSIAPRAFEYIGKEVGPVPAWNGAVAGALSEGQVTGTVAKKPKK